MLGETNLNVLIASMKPMLEPGEYVFCSVQPNQRNKIIALPILEFQEKEGITIILRKHEAEEINIPFVYPCRLITLNIHSSLEAVGFLAVITKHLASVGISVNAVSAYYHDHIFVPSGSAESALAILKNLSDSTSKQELVYNNLIPEIGISNYDKTLKFYTVVLPFTIEYSRPENGFAFLSLGGSQLMIEQISATSAATDQEFRAGHWRTAILEYPFGRGMSFSINVDSLDDIVTRLSNVQYPLKMEPREAWYRRGQILVGERQILVMDPDGYLLRFQQSLGVKPFAPSSH